MCHERPGRPVSAPRRDRDPARRAGQRACRRGCDRLYLFHRWQVNLRIFEVEEIKTVPYAPLSHPFVERLIGTIRRECLDRTLVWTAADLATKLLEFQLLLQRLSRPRGAGRASAGTVRRGGRRPRTSWVVSLAAALSWSLSHADGGVRLCAAHAGALCEVERCQPIEGVGVLGSSSFVGVLLRLFPPLLCLNIGLCAIRQAQRHNWY